METKPGKTYWQYVPQGERHEKLLGIWQRASSEEELREKPKETQKQNGDVLIGHPCHYDNIEGCFGHNGCARMI